MPTVALMILFNHNYEANIEKIEKIYQLKFDDIYFIMPFYKGKKPNVISVYENSFYFQGYISKALETIKHKNYQHYIIIGDDLILNPDINQHNYKTFFKLTENCGFMPGLFLLNDATQTVPDRPLAPYWPAIIDALKFRINQKGIEVAKYLPSQNDAIKMLHQHGLTFVPKISWRYILSPLKKLPFSKVGYENKKRAGKHYFANFAYYFTNRKLRYPLVGSYSDICIIPNSAVESMIEYCGIFAALNLFAEVALPTAFAFSVPETTMEVNLNFQGVTFWNSTTVSQFEKQHQLNLMHLFENFPEHALYVHPIKLSRWKTMV